jgi:hypothetical protein
MITIKQIDALYELYPQIVTTQDNIAYDADGNEITYDITAVNAKVAQNESDKVAQEQAQVSAKASALAKLAALGLTQDEIKALVG